MKTYNDGLATVLTADDLEDTHPELPSGYRRTMGMIIQYGGPWPCSDCAAASLVPWKCSRCGRPFTKTG